MRFSVSQVRLDFMERVSPVEKSIYSESVRNVGTMQVAHFFCHNGRNQKEVEDWQN